MSEKHQDKPASFSLKPWKKVWPALKKYKWLFYGAVITDVIMAYIDAYIPLMQSQVDTIWESVEWKPGYTFTPA